MAQGPEQSLVDAVTHGDYASLGRLLEVYQQRIYNVCLRMVSHRDDAAEVTQDVMLKIIEHIGDFRGKSDIGTWIMRIAMNLSVSHLRKRRLRQTMSLEGTGRGDGHDDDQSAPLREQLIAAREPDPASNVQKDETYAQLRLALERIDEDSRAIVVLRDIEEMDYQQIASVLSMPLGTVKSRLFRARLALRHEMLKLCPPPPRAHASQEKADV